MINVAYLMQRLRAVKVGTGASNAKSQAEI